MSAWRGQPAIPCMASVAITHGGFGLVQLHTSRQAALGEQAELRDDELVELWWGSARGRRRQRSSPRPAMPRRVTHLLGTQLHRVAVSPRAQLTFKQTHAGLPGRLLAPDHTMPKQARLLAPHQVELLCAAIRRYRPPPIRNADHYAFVISCPFLQNRSESQSGGQVCFEVALRSHDSAGCP